MRAGQSIKFFTSAPLLAELTDILLRPKFDKKIAASLLSVDQLVELYRNWLLWCALLRSTVSRRS